MTITQVSPRERIHRPPFGRVAYYTGSIKTTETANRRLAQPMTEDAKTHTCFPPSILALAGSPAEAWCLMPDHQDLFALDGRWPEKNRDRAAAVSLAIEAAFDAAENGRPWLNAWVNGFPVGLWHWTRRFSEDITPLNGGTMGMRYLWAVFDDVGRLCSLRISEGQWASTPAGIALSIPTYDWVFTERPWAPSPERKVCVRAAIDPSELPEPFLPVDDVHPPNQANTEGHS